MPGIYPSLAHARRLASTARYAPVYREVLADTETPVSVLLKLGAGPGSFLLENTRAGGEPGRYSLIASGPHASLELHDQTALLRLGAQAMRLPCPDPLELIQHVVVRDGVARLADLPHFAGGAVGYLGYEMGRKFEPRVGLAANDPLEMPLGHLLIPDTLVVFDHVRRTLKILTYMPLFADVDAEYARAVERIDAVYDRLVCGTAHDEGSRSPERAQSGDVISNVTRDEFEARVLRAKEQIAAGECFQIVLSQRLSRGTDASPVNLYRALRSINPSPYTYFINFGDYQIVGASPELLVRVQNGEVATCPIAGTRPRGASSAEDDALAAELLSDEKERAEHVMLVDLGRNDIGRVAEPGSVAVPRLMEVERYSHVMHIVSQVTGRLRAGLRGIDALRACFPAGTLTGAPKIRAMQVIADLEGEQRGPYGGVIGMFGFDGDVEAAITIRSIVLKDGAAHVQAGAGIVADSDPTREYHETLDKARAALTAVDEAMRLERGTRVPTPLRRAVPPAATVAA